MNLNKIRETGIRALIDRLGPVGMVRFLQQFDTGEGDYTRDRNRWLADLTMDDIMSELKRKRKRHSLK